MAIARDQVLRYRLRAQQLEGEGSRDLLHLAVLDMGVQDTGPDGAGWALANRGVAPAELADPSKQLVLAWTLRGAPHYYRRSQVAAVAAATTPFSDADAGKRIFDAAKQLRAAGISPLEALDTVGAAMREILETPLSKGDVSTQLTARLPAPYVRYCRVCKATHSYEQTFRLAALQAGVELQPGTSPPVLQRIEGWSRPAKRVPDSLDVVRAYLHLLGPATPKMVAAYVDAPVKEIKDRWPADAVEVEVDGEPRWILPADLPALESGSEAADVLLLSPFDLFLQAKDRELLVPDDDNRKELWVVLGRPGAIVRGGEIVGTWRPRAAGKKLSLQVNTWRRVSSDKVAEQAERLAAHRGVAFSGLTEA
jgi:hypothetical protein